MVHLAGGWPGPAACARGLANPGRSPSLANPDRAAHPAAHPAAIYQPCAITTTQGKTNAGSQEKRLR